MRKAVLTIIILTSFSLTYLSPQSNEANQLYIKAMTTTDLAKKVELLKEYISKYGGKGTEHENYVYATLCLAPIEGKSPKETMQYGEKALSLGGLDDDFKINLYLAVSESYIIIGQNLEKAKNYASQVVQIARAKKKKESSSSSAARWNKVIGAGYLLQGHAQEKAKSYKGALDGYINSFNILKDKKIALNLKRIGKRLYDSKSYPEAEKAFKIFCTTFNDFGSCVYYAKTLARNGKRTEALKYFKQAYAKKRSGEIAYNIGIIQAGRAKENPSVSPEAIKFLLEASFLSANHSKKAMMMAESLFFIQNKELKYNETVTEIKERNKKIEELTDTFNKKYGEKDEEDLSKNEKKEMDKLLKSIKVEEEEIKKLEARQKIALEKFSKLLEETKQRLGIK